MHKRPLGKTGLEVSAIGLGGMPLSLSTRPAESMALIVFRQAFESGVTLIDTADAYCIDDSDTGHNEGLIARALKKYDKSFDEIVVATKGGCVRPEGAWGVDGRPEHLKAACEHSLQMLGIERIDLYQLHAVDSSVPFEDSIGALVDLQNEGKIRWIGLSNVGVDHIVEAQELCEVVSVQNRCNVFERTSFTNGVVDYCTAQGITFLPHSPVGGHRGHSRTPDDPTLNKIAKSHHASPYQVCLAWLLAKSPRMIPIPGASRPESIRFSAAAADLRLSKEDMDVLDAAFPV